jgi:extradiol dioxygenase family protein
MSGFKKGRVYYCNAGAYGILWECLESTTLAHVTCQAIEFTGDVPDHITLQLFDPQTIVFSFYKARLAKDVTEYESKKAWEIRNEVKTLLA